MTDAMAPLAMWCCSRCGLTQLADDAASWPEVVGTEPTALVVEASRLVAEVAHRGHLPRRGTVREFGSPHGGSWLADLTGRGLTVADTVVDAVAVDVVVDSLGLMHRLDQAAALAGLAAAVARGGVCLVFFHSLSAIVAERQWNDLRHGHHAYYALPVLCRLLAGVGLSAVDAIASRLYGGSILLVARHVDDPAVACSEELSAMLAAETSQRLTDVMVLRSALQESVASSAAVLHDHLITARTEGRTVWGWAAASRAVTVLTVAGVGPDLLTSIADVSPAKQGRAVPGSRIPIVAPDALLAANPDEVLVFLPELVDEIAAAHPQLERRLVPYHPGASHLGEQGGGRR